ncbi:hypothetical protein ACFL0T_05840 [Candidatus Omnitrophota bacterium]
MDKNLENLDSWDVEVCPLRGKQCLRKKCAWWVTEEKRCAVVKIASLPAKN